ncbi:glycosyltransferase [Micromonospora sp. NIE79]|uniref:Glycosyltransferase n=1 Tax=Micromonospora trifolii TaxID=2911208 RepID=A0ABS9NBU8_9ACTN|nr:glycosyltransferase [Micromonospora trifolii]MCG5447293.1 glycosyltransferase [Micromonospora trifolii]
MTVGFLAPPWQIPPRAYGGVERAADELCRGLVSRGHEVRLWAARSSTCPVPTSGVIEELDHTKGWHTAPTELFHVLSGYRWLSDQGVDIIHDITYAGPLIGPSVVDVPVVTTNYLPFTPPLPGHSSPDLGLIYQTASRRVPVLAISHAQAAGASGFTPHMIHLGIDVKNTPFGDGAGDEKGPYVAFFGRMAPEKGVREAILAARAAGLRLKLASRVAEDHERAYFEDQVEPLIDGDDVQFLGEVDRIAGLHLLKDAVAMVNPIAWPEPFGLAMVESLATGTPIVARRSGAVDEVVRHGVTGAVCDSFEEVVEGLRKYRTYDRLACRTVAEEHFSTERMVDEHIRFYRSVLA